MGDNCRSLGKKERPGKVARAAKIKDPEPKGRQKALTHLVKRLRSSPDELVTLLFAREATTAPGTAALASSQDFDCIFVNASIATTSSAFVSVFLVA